MIIIVLAAAMTIAMMIATAIALHEESGRLHTLEIGHQRLIKHQEWKNPVSR